MKGSPRQGTSATLYHNSFSSDAFREEVVDCQPTPLAEVSRQCSTPTPVLARISSIKVLQYSRGNGPPIHSPLQRIPAMLRSNQSSPQSSPNSSDSSILQQGRGPPHHSLHDDPTAIRHSEPAQSPSPAFAGKFRPAEKTLFVVFRPGMFDLHSMQSTLPGRAKPDCAASRAASIAKGLCFLSFSA